MSTDMKRIAVLLDGRITNDGRVQRIVNSFSTNYLVDLYCIKLSDEDKFLFKNDNVKVIEHIISHSWIQDNFLFQKRFNNLKQQMLKQSYKYDLIYCNDYPLLEVSVELKEKTNCKLLFDSHEIYTEIINQFFPSKGIKGIVIGRPFTFLNKIYHEFRHKKLLEKLDLMVTVCDSLSDYFVTKYKIKKPVVLRNCPLDYKEIFKSNLLREKLKITKDKVIVFYQGVINPGRGLKKLIESSIFLDNNIVIVILGDGPSKNELVNLCKTLNADNVHFVERVTFSDLYNYIASADIGICTIESLNLSKKLSLPNKVFEYMAAGIPIITNKLPEVSKIVIEENCGYVIDDSTEKKLATELNYIAANIDPNKGVNGQKAIYSKYNWNTDFKKVEEEVKGILHY
jgi:glycosyltransferase involved in cell wall biosynthesis